MKRFFVVIVIALFGSANSVFADTTSTLRPTADGGDDSADWSNTGGTACNATDCYLEVDESSGASCTNSDGDTSYVESSTNAANQTFDIDESSIPDNATITQIDITICAVRGAGGAKIQTRRCVDGSCTNSGSDIGLGTSYAETAQSHTGLSITKGASTDIEIGIANTVAKAARVSQISAVITYTPPDTTAPAAVSDLAASGATTSTIDLAWTAPGDDGSTGTATTYDVRYSTSTITAGNFSSATAVTGEPTPSVAGTAESMTVSGLTEGTTYYFAIKASDEVPNESAISNVPSLATTSTPDTTAPAAVSDLAASAATVSTIDLAWTAPGDDGSTGTAATYDVRYSTATITAGNFSSATAVSGEPTPSVAGTAESMTVTGLSESTTYYFALKTSDEVPNESAISNVPSLATATSSDTTAPAAVTNLAVSSTTDTTASLTWTAPGDDGSTGTATKYDVRYSTSTITEGNWSSATAATGEPTPSVAGTAEAMTVGGLSSSTTYYFAIKASDEALNEGAISNIPSGTTDAPAPDNTAPAAVTDLALSSGGGNMTVSWTAPGDDASTGVATSYDLRYSTSALAESSWADATKVLGEPAPAAAGTAESMTVLGLNSATLYYFALKTSDEVPNESAISNVPSETTTTSSSGSGGARRAIFSGQAYPESTIELLRKRVSLPGYIKEPTETVTLLADGTFEIIQKNLIGENFLFALQVSDKDGRKTGFISFGVDLQKQNEIVARNIFVPPTLGVLDALVSKGEEVQLVGYAAPGNSIEYELHDIIHKAGVSDDSGFYTITLDTTEFDFADHYVRVRQGTPSGDEKSNFSQTGIFRVSELTFPRADFNKDEKVDITDWSVFLFRWGSEDDALKEKIDLDNNGKVDIADFSIFLKSMTI
jgi:hypothetical protein